MRTVVLRWLPLPILAVACLAAWGLARGRPVAEERLPPPRPPQVGVIEVRRSVHRVVVHAQGSVEPQTQIELVAEVPGRVARVSPSLAAGRFFEQDEVLVDLDRGDAELALERAQATCMRTGSEVDLARVRLERLRSLAANEVASPAKIEEAEHAWDIARAALREVRAARDQARRDLDRTRIRAPFSGRVRDRQVGVGQFVSRGTPLARIYAIDHAEVRLPIPSSELANLDVPLAGGAVPGEGPRATLRATFAGRPATWSARLVRLEGEIAPRSRMLHVVARVDDPYGREADASQPPLTPGLFVEAEIEGRRLDGVVVLPRTALRGAGEVLVVDASGHVRARPVEVLRTDGDRIVVGEGLAPGERVVASALGVLDGARVRPTPVDVP